jgi:CrcB protein
VIVPVVLLAGAAGAVLRFLVSRALAPRPGIPWAVLLVNVVGSAIGGVVLALAERGDVSSDIRLVLLTGLCGGLTTFSTWSVESIQLLQDGRWRLAVLSVAGNLVLGVAVAAAAYALVR